MERVHRPRLPGSSGPRVPRLTVGELAAVPVAGRVAVIVEGTTMTLATGRHITGAAVGDQVLVAVRGTGGYVIMLLGTGPRAPHPPPVDPPPPPPPVAPQTGSTTFKPTWTGTWRGSWRGDTRDLFQGDWTGRGNNRGAAFYGNGPSGLRGVCTEARLTVRRVSGGAYAQASPTYRLLAQRTRPGGVPTELASTTGPALGIGEKAIFALPTSWGQQLMDGSAGGIGIRITGSTPYIVLAAGENALRIDWRR